MTKRSGGVAMNRKYYQFGNPLKVRFGEHCCLRCGQDLTILMDRRIVDPHSEEAKYFGRAANHVIIEKRSATALRFSDQLFLGLQMIR